MRDTITRVVLTMRVTNDREHCEVRDAISHDFISMLGAHDLAVYLLPNVVRSVETYMSDVLPDAVILSGGNDIGPLFDGDVRGSSVNEVRDECERAALEYAVANKIPVLGVCRGMQMINAFFGGSIVRNFSFLGEDARSHAGVHHCISLRCPAFISWAGVDEVDTNSFHTQGVSASTLSPELVIAALSGQVVEAVVHKQLPIVGVQWHPEREGSCVQIDRGLFESMKTGFKGVMAGR